MTDQPNILFLMADQFAGPLLGSPSLKTPNIDKLVESGVTFESAYSNSPLCSPARFSMMAGRLPSQIGSYDNACEFTSSTPTFAHYMRNLGYRTICAGKMHFVGRDQLHGFEDRLTTDIYPSDFNWVPDWEHPEVRPEWYHNMLSVVQAGKCVTSNQVDFDEEVTFFSRRQLLDLGKPSKDKRPFFMMVSLTHPHDPYAIPAEYWDRYDHDQIDLPKVPTIEPSKDDPHSQRLRKVMALDEYDLTDERVKNARHAYYGSISYVDDNVGKLVKALEDAGLKDNTIIVFTSDHGDMLGERGLWYKMNYFEMAARIPMIVSAPHLFKPRKVGTHVSLVDLLPTFVSMACKGSNEALVTPVCGRSLYPILIGDDASVKNETFGEYMGEGAIAPIFFVRRDNFKFISCRVDSPQLYDLVKDPQELDNLANKPGYEEITKSFQIEVDTRWDSDKIFADVVLDQKRRRFIMNALKKGTKEHWDYQPIRDASRLYVRGHMDLDDIEKNARLPQVEIPKPDGPTKLK
ncbi:choline-sulfatase [Acrasis kona]|uniref:Choline-sulfatase n=1 Tax=Acrasis kona TaxID=1008807 RepID=A0AAW2ZI35_9EUKA